LKLRFAFTIAMALIGSLFFGVYKFDAMHKYHRKIDKIVLYLQWFDQAQFAGFYVAADRGFYDDLNLDVEIVPRPRNVEGFYQSAFNSNDNHIPSLAKLTEWNVPQIVSESTDSDKRPKAIGVWTGDQVLNRFYSEQLHLKVIGTVFSRSLACFLVKDKSRIFGPMDFSGKRVGVYQGYDTEIIYKWLTKHYMTEDQLPPTEVLLDPRSDAVELLSSGQVDVLPAYAINEPLVAQSRKPPLPVRIIHPDNYNVGYYSDTIIINAETWNNHRDVALRFLEATERGWRWALDNQDAAIDIVTRFDREHLANKEDLQKEMLSKLASYVRPNNPMFKMDAQVWRGMSTILSEQLHKPLDGCGDLCDDTMAELAHKQYHHQGE
jgi:NitT/TauT family transport system substrate-binding protein